jgi:hypothetical protein
MTTVRGENISGINLNLVEIIYSEYNKKSTNAVLSNQDLAFQEERKNRKVRKMEFEIR